MIDKELGLYILDINGEPKKVSDVSEWAEWFQDLSNRRIARTSIGDVFVSTVFLAMDPGAQYVVSNEHIKPTLFETTVIGGEQDGNIWRWQTKQDALIGHQQIVDKLTDSIKSTAN